MVPERLVPTVEQEKILKASGRVIKINARAGAGKTETLRLIADHNPTQKALYLVFNKRNKQVAEKKFPNNVKVQTVHGFAFSTFQEGFKSDEVFGVSTFLPEFDGDGNKQVIASLAHGFVVYFLNSTFERLEDAVGPYGQKYLDGKRQNLFSAHEDKIITTTRRLAVAWKNRQINCPHDFYLKLSYLQKNFQKSLERYDLILVDEGQDLSEVMLDALAHCKKRIVLVGDTHQRIYSFRHAVDAMQRLEADQTFELSLSFRFGESVAVLAGNFISEAKGVNGFRITGNRSKKSEIFFYSGLPPLAKGKQTAILSRTNLGLFRKAMLLKRQRQSYCFERQIGGDLKKILDIYRLKRGEIDQIQDSWIRSFESLGKLDEYAELVDDYKLLNMSKIVKDYATDFPDAIYEMIKLSNGDRNSRAKDAVILSTVHTAKGEQYEHVIIDEDIAEAIGRKTELLSEQFTDEANVAYVCLTRVKEKLWLPEAMKTILTPKWQAYMKSLVPPHRPPQKSIGRVQSTGHSIKKPQVPPPDRKYSIGEEVKISSNRKGDDTRRGVIVSIENGEYLIAVKGQEARVWEKHSTLNRYNN